MDGYCVRDTQKQEGERSGLSTSASSANIHQELHASSFDDEKALAKNVAVETQEKSGNRCKADVGAFKAEAAVDTMLGVFVPWHRQDELTEKVMEKERQRFAEVHKRSSLSGIL